MAAQRFGQAQVILDRQNDSYTPSEHYVAALHTTDPTIPEQATTGYTKAEALDRLAIWLLGQGVKHSG